MKLSILIPVRNEGVNIGIMLKILNAVIEVPYEALVIYDQPDDNTVPAVKKLKNRLKARLIFNNYGKGVSNAVKKGIDEAKGDYILLFAADEVGPVLAIEDMITLLDKGCDLVSCTRYAHGGRRLGGSFIQHVLSRLANKAFMTITGSSLTDTTTGIKMFKKSIFNNIKLEAKPVGWVVVFELAIKAQATGLKLGEVPIISIDRLYGGESSFRLGPWIKEYLKWFIWGVKKLR